MTPSYPSPVHIWQELVTIPTYPVPAPDPNPMFFEKRVNQGASGRIYPNPLTDRVNHETKEDRAYQAVFLENEYIQIMVMPQFGGRIHAALDKTNGYDFVYRQNVVKPALIGLFGSWVSGGMEFNWPLHHRPSTFMPVEYTIEHGEDGSATVWLSEHEPMNRMKGMLGVCMYPGKAYFEFKVQLYNRTPLPQPFLWWINCAVRVNENYQIIFPPDVESVTFHSRADMATYPIARQFFAGCDWRDGVDISFPNNVGPATSYFANPSGYDFFGGFDHGKQGGIIHVANHHVSPGKKCFTWGTGDFGTAWQGSLTDADGPYIELMASSYSDNQPDFSWLQPYETKRFSHIWYPIQQIGSVKNANSKLAVNLTDDFVGVCTTEIIPDARILVTATSPHGDDEILFDWQGDLIPGNPITAQLTEHATRLTVLNSSGYELISYTPHVRRDDPLPPTAKPPTLPHKIDNLEELYLTGLHVEQYLHFSLDPAPYWERALTLDSGDSRSNTALGRLKLRRGDFAAAEAHFRAAITTLTRYNFNPYDGEPYYQLGLALVYQGRYAEAYDAFYKGIWSYAWRSAGYYALAQIDIRRGDDPRALDHLDRTLVTNAHHNQARALKAAVLRRMGRVESALQTAREALALDPLNLWARAEIVLALEELGDPTDFQQSELTRLLRGSAQNYLDLALDYGNSALYPEALDVLLGFLEPHPQPLPYQGRGDSPLLSGEGPGVRSAPQTGRDYPMIYYALGYFATRVGDTYSALEWFTQAASQPADWCFPHRLEEQIILEAARAANPSDGRAAYYLGNLYYDKKQYEKAIAAWETATQLEPGFATAWRNLSIALYNKRADKAGAKRAYQQALAANPHDPRQIMEHDQLDRRLGAAPADRIAAFEHHLAEVAQRDDLTVDLAALYNQTGQPAKALDLLLNHIFHPWEGGEGQAATQYSLAHLLAGQSVLAAQPQAALEHFEAAHQHPVNLGVGRAMPGIHTVVDFYAAQAYAALDQADTAAAHYRKVVAASEASTWQRFSPVAYYAALAQRQLGDEAAAQSKLQGLLDHATEQLNADDQGGFYTSIPATVIFEEEPGRAAKITNHYLIGLAHKGLGNAVEARAAFEAVLALDPHHWEAQREIKSI
jgi:tetratricopeptide (TPR) repeat protein